MAGLVAHDHRGKHRFRHQLAANLGAAFEFPDIAAIALLGDADMETVAGHHGPAKPGVVDAHEIDELAFRRRPEGMDDEHRGGLRHRLDDQHARHHRTAREMALEIVFVDRDVLYAGG